MPSEPAMVLVPLAGGKHINVTLDTSPVKLGRAEAPDGRVSRHHVTLSLRGGDTLSLHAERMSWLLPKAAKEAYVLPAGTETQARTSACMPRTCV